MKVSNCCNASNIDFEDYGICPECREHCEFIEEDTCEFCEGTGEVYRNIPGNEGEPEYDIEGECPECKGTGKTK